VLNPSCRTNRAFNQSASRLEREDCPGAHGRTYWAVTSHPVIVQSEHSAWLVVMFTLHVLQVILQPDSSSVARATLGTTSVPMPKRATTANVIALARLLRDIGHQRIGVSWCIMDCHSLQNGS